MALNYLNPMSVDEKYFRDATLEKSPLYVLLKCYRSVKSHEFDVKNKSVWYKPFKLTFPTVPLLPTPIPLSLNGNGMIRVICAIAVSSLYKGKYFIIIIVRSYFIDINDFLLINRVFFLSL